MDGHVNLSEKDLRNAARYLRLTPEEFETRYVYRTRHRIRLRKPPGKQCHFLVEGGCGIHPAKPTQCRLFPFWPELVEHKKEWDKSAKWCPGMGKGPLIQIGTALETANEMRAAYPRAYRKT